MSGIDGRLVAERFEFAQAVKQQAGHFTCAIRIKITAAHVADEQRVAGKDRECALAEFPVVKREGQAVVGMAGGFEHTQRDRSDFELVAVTGRRCVLDVPGGVRAVQYFCPGSICQCGRTRQKVLVTVCLEDVGDPAVIAGCDLDVNVAVAPRVDDGGVAIAPYHVGQVREAVTFDFFDKHAAKAAICVPPA